MYVFGFIFYKRGWQFFEHCTWLQRKYVVVYVAFSVNWGVHT